jgi:hypothetical protein
MQQDVLGFLGRNALQRYVVGVRLIPIELNPAQHAPVGIVLIL